MGGGEGELIEKEGRSYTVHRNYTHSSIAIPKWSMHIWTLTTGGRISRTKEAYVRHACASVALFYPFRFLLQSFSSSFRRNTLVGGVEGDVADSMALQTCFYLCRQRRTCSPPHHDHHRRSPHSESIAFSPFYSALLLSYYIRSPLF